MIFDGGGPQPEKRERSSAEVDGNRKLKLKTSNGEKCYVDFYTALSLLQIKILHWVGVENHSNKTIRQTLEILPNC